MGLLSKFKIRRAETPSAPRGATSDPVEQVREVRLKARRRLIGVTLLLVVGIIGFPLLFETQPRPIPVDIPIEIPSRDAAPPLQMAPRGDAPTASVAPTSAPAAAGRAAAPDEVVEPTVRGASAAASLPLSVIKPPAAAAMPGPSTAKSGSVHDTDAPARSAQTHSRDSMAADSKPAHASTTDPKSADSTDKKDGTRKESAKKDSAKADVKAKEFKSADGKSADAKADEGRFVIQIGAFAEAAGARDARGKVELLGLSTYTQVIESASGRRIRVRVGPFTTRAEADKAAARIKSAGLPAAVLKL